MHDSMLWRTTAAVAATGALCVIAACGGEKSTAGKSTTPDNQSTQTTTSSEYSPAYTGPTGTTSGTTTTDTSGMSTPPPTRGADMDRSSTGTSGTMGSTPGGSTSSNTTTGTTGPTGTGTTGDLSNLSDEQIVAITGVANAGEIEQAQLVKEHSKNAQVKKFAEHMIADHGQIARDQQRLETRLNITPMQNMTSQQMTSDGRQLMDALRKEKGTDFDRDYIDAQVREHRDLLNMLDNNLIPQAKSAELKSTLQGVRAKVQAHLREAENIQRALPKP